MELSFQSVIWYMPGPTAGERERVWYMPGPTVEKEREILWSKSTRKWFSGFHFFSDNEGHDCWIFNPLDRFTQWAGYLILAHLSKIWLWNFLLREAGILFVRAEASFYASEIFRGSQSFLLCTKITKNYFYFYFSQFLPSWVIPISSLSLPPMTQGMNLKIWVW